MFVSAEQVREQIRRAVSDAYTNAAEAGDLANINLLEIFIEVPGKSENGDFSCNLAKRLAGTLGKPSSDVADIIISYIRTDGTYIKKIKNAGAGFINFYLNDLWLFENMVSMLSQKFNYRKINTAIDINNNNLQSRQNPLYFIQYTHARICSLLRMLKSDISPGSYTVTPEELMCLQRNEELIIIKRLSNFPDVIKKSSDLVNPSVIIVYACDIADLFHNFYSVCSLKGIEPELHKARVVLLECIRIVMYDILDLLSMPAPDKM